MKAESVAERVRICKILCWMDEHPEQAEEVGISITATNKNSDEKEKKNETCIQSN